MGHASDGALFVSLAIPGRVDACRPAFLDIHSLKELPVDFPMPQPPALIVTLKNRTLTPPVQRFIDCAREVARSTGAP